MQKRNENFPVLLSVIGALFFALFCIGMASVLSAMYKEDAQLIISVVAILLLSLVLGGAIRQPRR